MFCTHRFNFVGIAAFILILLNQSAFAADAEVDGGNIVITPCKGKPDGYKYIVRGVEKVCNKGLVVVDLNNSGNVYEDNNGSATSTTGSGSGTGSNSGSGNGSGTSNSYVLVAVRELVAILVLVMAQALVIALGAITAQIQAPTNPTPLYPIPQHRPTTYHPRN
ncbi:hypothetical protein [Kingella kingae]|uniref:hypothetical protein n=1 Tax=Kingella kingae TaxID=504 RepID=UPI00056F01F0|nr:hypothetical protein [Kingella kingae]